MKGKEKIILLIGITAIVLVIILGYFYGPNNHIKSIEQRNIENLTEINELLNQRYINEVYPIGKNIISAEVEEVKKEKDHISKLDNIFKWELSDWHNPKWFWYNVDLNETGFSCYPISSCHYFIYNNDIKKLKVNNDFNGIIFPQKNPNGTWLIDDPYWIAYNKVGACRELANLFAFVASESGFETRIIQTLADHRWVEVKINGEWMYYDPWCAIEKYHACENNICNLSMREKWFNKIENYRDNCHGGAYINWYYDPAPNPIPSITYPVLYSWSDFKKMGGLIIYRN